ncbi:MAG TPA: hypothetical protein VFT13_10575 [Candidatus Krumholzibacteria bacterium]|nr:hypothetical protein [Candidatus Krumholzibacteria bacterium]
MFVAFFLCIGISAPVHAQKHTHEPSTHSNAMMSPGGVSHTRDASGTAWEPDSTPIHAYHYTLGDWMVMTHFNAFLAYDKQWGPRGNDQLNSINWLMIMASRPLGAGALMFRGMFSLEPATTTAEGYPLLFQSGEVFEGRPLVDRQHPHDLFMELAARYRYPLAEKAALSLYLAPSGEPALGPPVFMHRASAADIPAAPLTHHWLDSTHISFGVATLGVVYDRLQLEGSIFNGHEPDEHRWNFDPIDLDSYAGRLTCNPTPNWSLQASFGYLHSPEQLHPEEDAHRTTMSVIHNGPQANGGNWATTAAWGVNRESGVNSSGVLLESLVNIADRHVIFGRVEYVEKSGEDLATEPEDESYGITELTLGASREVAHGKPCSIAIGASVTYNFKPSSLDSLYGDSPVGLWIFLRVRPDVVRRDNDHVL